MLIMREQLFTTAGTPSEFEPGAGYEVAEAARETLTGEEIVELFKGHPPARDTGDDHEPPLRGSPVPTTGVVRPKPGPGPGGLEPQPQA
jgi:hypothetical protein